MSTGAFSAALGIRRRGPRAGARLGSVKPELTFTLWRWRWSSSPVSSTPESGGPSCPSIIIFAFRATPSVGDGYFWWTLDVLKFDEAFYGTLRQTAAIIAIAAMWAFSKQSTEYSVTKVLLWLAIAGTILSLPNIGLFYALHHWTEATFGFGARAIAVIDAATASPFVQLSMIPLLTLTAFYAPAGHRATWFALMASLMNMALVAGQLQTKYLNQLFVVGRGDYSELAAACHRTQARHSTFASCCSAGASD